MFRKLWSGQDRRRFPRTEAALDLSIEVEMYGFDDNRPFFASGRTIDISRGGLFAVLDAPIAAGSVCKLFFHDAGAHVRPSHLAARVLRCREEGNRFLIAVEFDVPLLALRAGAGEEVAAVG